MSVESVSFRSTTSISLHDRFTALKTANPSEKFDSPMSKINNSMGSRKNQQLVAQMENKFIPHVVPRKRTYVTQPKKLMNLQVGHVSAKDRLSIPVANRINTFLGSPRGSVVKRGNISRGNQRATQKNRMSDRISKTYNQQRGGFNSSIGNRITNARVNQSKFNGRDQRRGKGNLNAASRISFKSNQTFANNSGTRGRGQNQRGRGPFRGRGRGKAW